MDSKLKRKTIYSPVERHSDLAPIEKLPTLAKLRYLDDTTTTSEEDHGRPAEPAAFEKCPRTRVTKQPARLRPSELHASNSSDNFGTDHDGGPRQDDTASLEEVYLCTCCGVTRQLKPAMKYMPLLRSLFLLFNFLAFAFGLASFGMGLWFRIDPKVYEIHKYIETQNYTLAGWMMLFSGFVACLMSLAALAAVSRRSICLLVLYAVTMTILTISSIGALVLLTVYGLGPALERFMSKEIYEQIRRRTMSTELDLSISSDAAQFLDFLQVKLRCCGAQDFRDYQKLGMVIPTTCYTIAANYINAPGCGQALRRLFDLRAGLAIGILSGGVVVELALVVVSSLLVCSIYNWRATSRPASAAHHLNEFSTSTPR